MTVAIRPRNQSDYKQPIKKTINIALHKREKILEYARTSL